jgi:hypothetical protein
MAAFTECSSTGGFGRTLFTYSRPLGTRHFTLITDGCSLHGRDNRSGAESCGIGRIESILAGRDIDRRSGADGDAVLATYGSG